MNYAWETTLRTSSLDIDFTWMFIVICNFNFINHDMVRRIAPNTKLEPMDLSKIFFNHFRIPMKLLNIDDCKGNNIVELRWYLRSFQFYFSTRTSMNLNQFSTIRPVTAIVICWNSISRRQDKLGSKYWFAIAQISLEHKQCRHCTCIHNRCTGFVLLCKSSHLLCYHNWVVT